MSRPALSLFALLFVGACTAGPSTTDTATIEPLDPHVPPVTEGRWVRPGLRTTWQWQLQGLTNTHFDADLYDIDLDSEFTVISTLRAKERLVFCNVSAGTLESWRDDAGSFPDHAVGNPVAGFPDEAWLDVRDPDVHRLMLDRLDRAVIQGCDGVELDQIGGFEQDTGFAITRDEQLAYVRFLYNAAHDRDLAVAQKDLPGFVADLVAYADAVIAQRCHELDNCDAFDAYPAAGKPLLNAEYAESFVEDPAAFCVRALADGTRSLILSEELDNSIRLSCDEDFPSTTALADVLTYATYYGRDAQRIRELSGLDLAIVQPVLTMDQLRGLQTTTEVAAYLSIGEIGLSNTYRVDGEVVLGQVVYDEHKDWFLGKNPFFDSWFADTRNRGWQDFVLEQAALLIEQGYDGVFMDTVDTVDVYPETIAGMVELIERLDRAQPGAFLVQNRGMNVIPQTGASVDALMYEVFSSRFDFEAETYVPTDPNAPGAASCSRSRWHTA